MTDKQIIIDDVDVSGCEYWKGYCRIASLCDYAGHLCEVNPNCYYKQLKRKEQECERYKQALIKIEEIAMCIMDNDLQESSAYYDAKQILQKISESEVDNAR